GNGVDLARFRPRRSADEIARARAVIGAEPGKVVAGTVGRLVWQKGFRELFAAAAVLRKTHPELLFVIVGPDDPSKGDALTAIDRTEAEKLGNVTFLGHRDDVEDL